MFFIHPMWSHESQRIGKMRCTPTGYRLHMVSDGLGFLGLLSFLALVVYLIVLLLKGDFSSGRLLLFTIPLTIDILSTVLYHYSWKLAKEKGFEYDDSKREARWVENGTPVTYRYGNNPQ